jgi:hypothetical protein
MTLEEITKIHHKIPINLLQEQEGQIPVLKFNHYHSIPLYKRPMGHIAHLSNLGPYRNII